MTSFSEVFFWTFYLACKQCSIAAWLTLTSCVFNLMYALITSFYLSRGSAICGLRGSVMQPPACCQNPHTSPVTSYLKANTSVCTSNGVRREAITESWSRFQLALSSICTLSQVILNYCQLLLSVRLLFSLCLVSPPNPTPFAVRPSTVSASCNSALHLKTSAPALKHGRCAMDHNIYVKNIERVISHGESAFCVSVCIQLCV